MLILSIACVLLATSSGCALLKKDPRTIAVHDDTVPCPIKKGEPAPFDGWIMSKLWFSRLAPGIYDSSKWGRSENEPEAKHPPGGPGATQ